jgi:hypothetical protein
MRMFCLNLYSLPNLSSHTSNFEYISFCTGNLPAYSPSICNWSDIGPDLFLWRITFFPIVHFSCFLITFWPGTDKRVAQIFTLIAITLYNFANYYILMVLTARNMTVIDDSRVRLCDL